jgi:hypothetical protein
MTIDSMPLDDGARKLGLLMETAHSHQDLIDDSLRQLQAHTQGLDQVIRDEIRRAFVAELGELMEESARAAEALRALGHAVTLRVAWRGTVLGIVPGAIVALLLACSLPAPGRIAALRLEHEQLSAAVARLADSGGRVDLRRCGEQSRLCVRVDRRAPAYGEQSDYLVVRGY